jgi:hypothetical protein
MQYWKEVEQTEMAWDCFPRISCQSLLWQYMVFVRALVERTEARIHPMMMCLHDSPGDSMVLVVRKNFGVDWKKMGFENEMSHWEEEVVEQTEMKELMMSMIVQVAQMMLVEAATVVEVGRTKLVQQFQVFVGYHSRSVVHSQMQCVAISVG